MHWFGIDADPLGLSLRACSLPDILFLMLLIRPAKVDDVGLLRAMIHELAAFECLSEFCVIDEATLARDGFGTDPKFEALIAEWDGEPTAYAIFFGYYSTWVGPGLYLEDIFVRPEFRGKGIGTALMAAIAKIAVERNCAAMRWQVLDWNKNAVALYEAMGAKFSKEWSSVSLTDENLQRLARRSE